VFSGTTTEMETAVGSWAEVQFGKHVAVQVDLTVKVLKHGSIPETNSSALTAKSNMDKTKDLI